MRISWVHPELAARAQAALRAGLSSWEEAFRGDAVIAGEPPEGFDAGRWPALAEHVARVERVREVVAQAGLDAAARRFGASPHAVERAALAQALAGSPSQDPASEADVVRGVLACAIDELVAYGHFLSRLVELEGAADPGGTVATFEAFVAAGAALDAHEPSWPERLHAAQDALAGLYVRAGREDDAEALYARRFADDPVDTALAIGAARVFLEAGSVARAVSWLERGAGRAAAAGRRELAARLSGKVQALRARLS
jgi:hypothetical protein